MTQPKDLSRRLLEASAWQIRLNESDGTFSAADEVEFAEWCAMPGNAAAWEQVMKPWSLIGEHASLPQMIARRQTALTYAKNANARLHGGRRHWHRRQVLGASAAVLALGMGGYYWISLPEEYSTGFGERRVIRLSDGSIVSLDSASAVIVRYTRDERRLHLLQGQARFDVAHEVERPFSVTARQEKIIATGTAFNVDMTGKKLLVTLIEGRVVVVNEAVPVHQAIKPSTWSRHRAVELTAGQQLAALPQRPPKISLANLRNVTSWTNGQLIFDNQPLSKVVERINYYSKSPIIIASPAVGDMRISGSFNTGDTSGFLELVTRYLPIKEQRDAQDRIVLIKK